MSERAYGHVPHAALWRVHQESGVSGSFLQTIQSLFNCSESGISIVSCISATKLTFLQEAYPAQKQLRAEPLYLIEMVWVSD